MIVEKRLLSADEFLEIETPDTVRLELDEGVISVSPNHTWYHQGAAGALFIQLWQWAKQTRSGVVLQEMDVRVGVGTVRTPDIVFVEKSQIHLIQRRCIVGPPRLAVEILSESTVGLDRGRKAEQYAAAGVPEYWLVDPLAQALEILTNDGAAFVQSARHERAAIFGPPGFGGLEIRLAELWLELP